MHLYVNLSMEFDPNLVIIQVGTMNYDLRKIQIKLQMVQ